MKLLLGAIVLLTAIPCALATVANRQVLNDGQVVLEGVPRIPAATIAELEPYLNARSTWFLGWSADSERIYVKTRAKGINQVHRVDRAGAAPRAMAHTGHPVGEVVRQPGGSRLAFTMSRDGSGEDQIYLLDETTGSIRRLTDGRALNNRLVWDRGGTRIAWRSTRRDGRHNDLWVMHADDPAKARLVLAVNDGALWKPVSFSRDGQLLLVQYFAGVTDSRVYLLHLETGQLDLLAGSPDRPSSNLAAGFDASDTGIHFVTNQRKRAAEIAWVSLAGEVNFVPENIQWDITDFELSADGRRGAFVINEEGISRLYLFDPEKREYKRVRRTPVGIISGLGFSPDGRKLGMTLNTPRTLSDAFVLKLGRHPLNYRRLVRWTDGVDDQTDGNHFVIPRLFHFPAPARFNDQYMMMPAFYYRPPRRRGPFPVIIYIHGGPEGQFRPGYNSTIQMWLDKLGAAVIAPNVRGSMGYGAAYLALDNGPLREHAVQDIGALLDWIETQPELDQNRVAIYGASYGGYMALASTVHFGDRISAAVNRAGISHFVTYLENTRGYRRDLRRVEYGDERIPEMRDFLQRISPLSNADRIRTPLLIAQGRNDPVVPESESLQMVAALRERQRTVWYVNALNEGHRYERKENRDLFEQVTYLFLRRYLLGERSSAARSDG